MWVSEDHWEVDSLCMWEAMPVSAALLCSLCCAAVLLRCCRKITNRQNAKTLYLHPLVLPTAPFVTSCASFGTFYSTIFVCSSNSTTSCHSFVYGSSTQASLIAKCRCRYALVLSELPVVHRLCLAVLHCMAIVESRNTRAYRGSTSPTLC